MPLQATSGAASYDAFGGGVPVEPNYIESCFSTWLYPSISGDNQIVNNIDLSGKGGLVWIKSRDRASNHYLIDTVRGSSVGDTKSLSSNTTTAQTSGPNLDWLQFNNNGFTAKAVAGGGELGTNTFYGNMASWTLRRQPKFFDVVTYTGNGSGAQQISHSLASVPGAIFIKRTDASSDWFAAVKNGETTYATGGGSGANFALNSTNRAYNSPISNCATSTIFKPFDTAGAIGDANISGATYVAYLFAHNAGGFGLTGTDNVISCGSYAGSNTVDVDVNLGFEPQFVMIKNITTGSTDWYIADIMRGMALTGIQPLLAPNLSDAESGFSGTFFTPTATGMKVQYGSGTTICSAGNNYIYIAIRRGPMKVPTDGTKVFDADTLTPAANLTGTKVTNPFATDLVINAQRDHSNLPSTYVVDRLRGGTQGLTSNSTGAEFTSGTYNWKLDYNDGLLDNFAYPNGTVTTPMIYWSFKRAPGFFDEVCYTGNSTSGLVVNHNLAVVPELVIFKKRAGSTGGWPVWTTSVGTGTSFNYLNATSAVSNQGVQIFTTTPTSTAMTLGSWTGVNDSNTMVAYLFASCPGVSKVFNYTGNGSSQTINCGFTGGARFVMIKRTDSTGDWYVWDSARGIVSGNDPRLSLNTTAAEVTTDDSVDTDSTGFVVNQLSATNINVSSATYIGIAIA